MVHTFALQLTPRVLRGVQTAGWSKGPSGEQHVVEGDNWEGLGEILSGEKKQRLHHLR